VRCRRLWLPERNLHPRRHRFSLFWPDVTRCVQRYIQQRDCLTVDGVETQSLEILVSAVYRQRELSDHEYLMVFDNGSVGVIEELIGAP